MNHPQGSTRPTNPLGGLLALLALTAVCFGIRYTVNPSFFKTSDRGTVAESPYLVYGRLLGRYQKLLSLLERIEQAEASQQRHDDTEQYNRLAREYNEQMESQAFPFTERSQVPPGSPGPLPRYVSLREQQ